MIFLCKLFSLFLLLASIYFVEFGSGAPIIPKDEVQVLRTIAAKLNIKYWSVSQTSCSDGGQSFNHTFRTNVLSNVTCDCSFNSSTVCHVTNIQLKGLNLSGVLLDEFADLAHLRELDLTWNYLSGTIPKSFSKLPLMILGLLGNRLSGPIPDEITQISTLEVLVLESNQLVGPLPPNLGNLKRLRRLLLSSNFFTGTIPETFANLKNLTFFLIDGNRISGKIPEFIGNWTNISMLNLEGTAMEGPIPKNISLLKNITELRISDLNGTSATFPDLQDMKNLQTLVLRNCLLTGPIPDFIGELTNLKTIDLSFNMLTGKIPDSMQNLNQLNFMFLTNNSLSGAVPPWVLESKQKFDVSYNNFTGSPPFSCQQSSVNLVSSYSSTKDSSVTWCLKKDLPCPNKPQYHSLFINCGGGKMKYDGHDYEEDTSSGGPSNFYAYGDKWAYSSTGVYLFNDRANFIASNTLGLNMTGPVYYQTARLAPSSLKYYGLCLREGSYRVQLHFAEIQFSDDQKWTSNGRRIFDISIQGNVVLKDFNITEEAGGVGKGITKNFKDIRVNDSTLVIHLYWAGQGTTAIPHRGVYGPLISAITVTPNFKTDTGLPAGSIAGIVIGSVMAVALALVILRMTGYLGGRGDDNEELKRLGIGYFSLRHIKAATDDFNPINKIGEGGFGPVYKGVLQDGKVIAVKQLSAKSKQGNREFVNEIGTISALQHPNLVKLYGCCVEGKELLLIYEYLENNSLARALFGRREHRLNLDWPTRMRICLDIAKGLRFLHEESRLKIVHRDIKANNVLLDKDLNAKISDFGLAKLDEEEENTHMTTRIAGTAGYMAPEYAMRGHLSDKADVYSFGVVLLEIVSGKGNTSYRPSEEFTYLLDWAYVLQEQGDLLDLVDPILGSNYSEAEALRIMSLALLCTNPSPILRPAMSAVVSMIEGNAPVQAPIVKPSGKRDPRFRALDGLSQNSHSQASTFSSQMQSSKSTDGALLDSSASTQAMADVAGHSSSGRLLSDSFQAN